MLTNELLQFIQREENISMKFLKQSKIRRKGADPLYLYGAGVQKLHVVRFLQKYGIKINAILDSFQEGSYQGIPIIKFADFLRSSPPPRSWFVISSPSAEGEIRKKLERYFPKENIFCFVTTPYVEWIPDVEEYRAYLMEHWDELSQMYDTFADETSRKAFINIIKGRISGRIDYFREVYSPDTYYPENIIHLAEGEVLAEAGSYDGATLLEFIKHCPAYKAAYCFEPDKNNLQVLNEAVKKVQASGKIKIIPKGAWDCYAKLSFSDSSGATNLSHIDAGNGSDETCIETVTIDEMIDEPITYLKMSINGAEERALQGAKRQIEMNHPKICVCVSYSGDGLLNIWNYLRKLVPGYRFYLRHHLENEGIESFLYAI